MYCLSLWKCLDFPFTETLLNESYKKFTFINSRARDPSPMTRVSPADASATIGVVIAQITSTDILTCIQALAQVGFKHLHSKPDMYTKLSMNTIIEWIKLCINQHLF